MAGLTLKRNMKIQLLVDTTLTVKAGEIVEVDEQQATILLNLNRVKVLETPKKEEKKEKKKKK